VHEQPRKRKTTKKDHCTFSMGARALRWSNATRDAKHICWIKRSIWPVPVTEAVLVWCASRLEPPHPSWPSPRGNYEGGDVHRKRKTHTKNAPRNNLRLGAPKKAPLGNEESDKMPHSPQTSTVAGPPSQPLFFWGSVSTPHGSSS